MKQNTVTEKILNECERAVLDGKPIIILRTEELELVREIIESDRLVVRLSRIFAGGVDSEEFIPTRFLPEKTDLKLFRTSSSNNNININVHYITKNNSKTFAFEDEANYGIPQQTNGLAFPSLYLFHYTNHDGAHPMRMWSEINLQPFIDRYLRESLTCTHIASSVILVFGDVTEVPSEIEPYCEIIDEPYPEVGEVKMLLKEYEKFETLQNSEVSDIIADAFLGLPLYQIKRLLRSMAVTPLDDSTECILSDEKKTVEAIQKFKRQILKKSDLLELLSTENDSGSKDHSSIGGMKSFKTWIEAQKRSIKEGDRLKREVGVYPPKGVLLCGIPGCGKSMAVASVSQTLKVPLLKLDVGKLMGKYVGESEHNMIKALRIAEAMAPCVLFIDELDKGFSGAGSGSDDSGPFKRMFGTLLSWMQDCKKPCFIFATANDISGLPKEFFRSGRFDCLYSLYMPTEDECIDIFTKQMEIAENKTGNRQLFSPECYNADSLSLLMNELGNKKRFVTGADITKLVSISLRSVWNGSFSKNPLTWYEWKTALLKALSETSVYGDSKENLDSIAACYIRLLRSNFIPASDNPLFTKEDYIIKPKEYGEDEPKRRFPEYEVQIKENDRRLSIYDKALKETLTPLIEEYGAVIEDSSLRRML